MSHIQVLALKGQYIQTSKIKTLLKANTYMWAEREHSTITVLRHNISLWEGVQKAHSLLFERLDLMKIPQKTQISRKWNFFQDIFITIIYLTEHGVTVCDDMN